MDCKKILFFLSVVGLLSACVNSGEGKREIWLGPGVSSNDVDFVKGNWMKIENAIREYESRFCSNSHYLPKAISSLDRIYEKEESENLISSRNTFIGYRVGTTNSCASDGQSSDAAWDVLISGDSIEVVDFHVLSE